MQAFHYPGAFYSDTRYGRPGGEAVYLLFKGHQRNEVVEPFFVVKPAVAKLVSLRWNSSTGKANKKKQGESLHFTDFSSK